MPPKKSTKKKSDSQAPAHTRTLTAEGWRRRNRAEKAPAKPKAKKKATKS